MRQRWMEKAEAHQPWVIYTFGRNHDLWWPLWRSTRVLGYAKIGMLCCVCGKEEIAKIRIPRFGSVTMPGDGRHPYRLRFIKEHEHPDRGHPMSWAKPLKNMNVFGPEGIDLDMLAMRTEAEVYRAEDDDGVGGW